MLLLGSARLELREAPLSDWGVRILERRLRSTGRTNQPVVCEGRGQSAASLRTSAVAALVRDLTDAGLRSDPTIKAGSVRAWAGHRIFCETGRIEAAALALGCKTLDTAAAIIGFDWRNQQ